MRSFNGFFQFEHFIPKAGGLQEVHLFSGFLHGRFCFLQHFLQFRFAHVSGNGVGNHVNVLLLDVSTGGLFQHGFRGFTYLGRGDAVLTVVFHLFLSTIPGFIDGFLHGAGNRVGIHDDFTV